LRLGSYSRPAYDARSIFLPDPRGKRGNRGLISYNPVMAVQRRGSRSPDPPKFISPQLTKLVDAAPEGDEWAHEIKLDGYRLHARIVDKQARSAIVA